MGMNHTEAKIQAEIVKFLQSQGLLFCSVPNEAAGKNAAIRMAQLKTLGLKSGAPDLIVFLDGGKIVCLEVKSPTGSQSPAQIDFAQKLAERSHAYFIVRTVQEAADAIKASCGASGAV